ncbi:hypothetical protein AVEN_23648-1 [Araneus ventricosus]|uniref:RNase H type-1 domain-containing protein n=1 Tax=Araneus ventricosus TaxID=182803 RepID=A0A4Y2BH60_ARAVE|nr:hypothetical protein AVEN_23648-1 [Araneus ventricosus]
MAGTKVGVTGHSPTPPEGCRSRNRRGDSLPSVFFRTELLIHTNKSSQHPEYLRRAALEVINNIPIEATLIYTDADYCSVFRSEMIAIDMALDFVLEHQLFGEIWILSRTAEVLSNI